MYKTPKSQAVVMSMLRIEQKNHARFQQDVYLDHRNQSPRRNSGYEACRPLFDLDQLGCPTGHHTTIVCVIHSSVGRCY
jgi:hypothetical protein